jgi:5'-nucleotidase
MSDHPQGERLLKRIRNRFAQDRFRQIYCNRDLVTDRIRWLGFDMDYTLAIYRREALDEVVHRLTIERLVHQLGYPTEVLAIPFDPHFAIRGLVVDKSNGHILKVDSHYYVGKGFHGFRPLERHELEEYRKHPPNIGSKRFALIDTLFELPEAYLYAALVDLLEALGRKPDYDRMADDIRRTIDTIHADNSLKSQVVADPERFLFRDPELGATLESFRVSGRRVFLMTNSWADYTDKVMSFLLGAPDPASPGTTGWRRHFDIIITAAQKPSFFRGHAPFLTLDESWTPQGEQHEGFVPGVVYQHGNIQEFEKFIGLRGDEILYIGDHIYGDIVRSKRDSAWRTAMIIPEMEEELRTIDKLSDTYRMWNAYEIELRTVVDTLSFEADLLDHLRAPGGEVVLNSLESLSQVEDAVQLLGESRVSLLQKYHELVAHCKALERNIDSHFHPRWGSLFKEGNEQSVFGGQVENYACLYTSRVSNFSSYSPTYYFRSPPDFLPHEIR